MAVKIFYFWMDQENFWTNVFKVFLSNMVILSTNVCNYCSLFVIVSALDELN